MRSIRRIALIGVLAATPAVARAEAGPCDRPNQRETVDCLSRTLSDAEATLKRYETAAEDALKAAPDGSKSLKEFVEAAASWSGYRDGECNAIFDQFGGATAGPSFYQECAIDITRSRTHEIWRNFLKPIGGAPPLLREP